MNMTFILFLSRGKSYNFYNSFYIFIRRTNGLILFLAPCNIDVPFFFSFMNIYFFHDGRPPFFLAAYGSKETQISGWN